MSESKTSKINNGGLGDYGSGGSMCNPMYRKVCSDGVYVPTSGRGKRRLTERLERRRINKLNKNKFNQKEQTNPIFGFRSS